MGYVPLHMYSNHTFLEGASNPAELIDRAHELGLPAVALTDRDGVYGIVRAHVRARELGIKLIAGSQVSVADGAALILLAQSREGYGTLCRLLTRGRRRCRKGRAQVDVSEILAHSRGLIALAQPTPGGVTRDPGEAPPDLLRALAKVFGDRLYLLLSRHLQPDDEEHVTRGLAWAQALHLPLVASPTVRYHLAARKPLCDILTCIRHGTTIFEAGTALNVNAEHTLPTPSDFARRFADLPDAVATSLEIAARCRFSLDEIRYRYPSESLDDGTTTRARLRALTMRGAARRYGGPPPPKVGAQLAHELDTIAKLDYEGYFLTMWEIVEFCRREGILCQGRGSAANSAVCYCLGITAIDPVRMDLLFERFISLERAEPPDIDLDIQSNRREEVIQWVYKRYGRRHAALVAVTIRYRPRSAVRDVGKALGFGSGELERLAALAPRWGDSLSEEVVSAAGLDPRSSMVRKLIALATEICGFPRHLAQHPGGFLLGHEPVDTLVPIENAAMPERTVIQWDKEDLEALGLFKVDLLGLGMLAALDRCFRLLAETRAVALNLATIPAEDPATYEMCRRADTIGVFQIESRAQMSMLPRLKPRTFYDLVVQIAIIRPGPITGGMVHPYLRRKNGREPVTYPHECLRPILAKTLGVPLFQEQVMKLAVVAAGYTPGEADNLRRDMAAWRIRGRLERHRHKLVEGMRARGIAQAFAERIFLQIRGFGEYGFPESHAASFALIAYASAYLKRHYPAEFTCALLNSQPMGFYSPATIVHDARRRGVRVLPVDLQASAWDCTVKDGAVRLGLRYVKGLGSHGRASLEEARADGNFKDFKDFARRTRLDRAGREALAAAGALRSLPNCASNRRQALWHARAATPEGLVEERHPEPELAELSAHEEIAWDYQATALSPRGHPLTALRAEFTRAGICSAVQLNALPHGRRARYVGLVICRQQPATAKGVTFLSLEDEGGLVNVVLRPALFERAPALARATSLLGVTGRVESRDGVVHLVADRLWRPTTLPETLAAGVRARDFT